MVSNIASGPTAWLSAMRSAGLAARIGADQADAGTNALGGVGQRFPPGQHVACQLDVVGLQDDQGIVDLGA